MMAQNMPRSARAQPLDILNIDDAQLTLETVRQLTGLSKAFIYKHIRAGTFPEPVHVSTRAVRWRAEEIRVWLHRNRDKPQGHA